MIPKIMKPENTFKNSQNNQRTFSSPCVAGGACLSQLTEEGGGTQIRRQLKVVGFFPTLGGSNKALCILCGS